MPNATPTKNAIALTTSRYMHAKDAYVTAARSGCYFAEQLALRELVSARNAYHAAIRGGVA